jgi:hypothetical protein
MKKNQEQMERTSECDSDSKLSRAWAMPTLGKVYYFLSRYSVAVKTMLFAIPLVLTALCLSQPGQTRQRITARTDENLTRILPWQKRTGGYSGARATTGAPTSSINSGFHRSTTGVAWLQPNYPYVVAGFVRDINYFGNAIFPYTAGRAKGDPFGSVQYISSNLLGQYTSSSTLKFQVQYIGNSVWQPTYCDSTSICKNFFQSNGSTVRNWPVGDPSSMPYVISGIESTSNPIGTIRTRQNEWLFSGTWTRWCNSVNNVFTSNLTLGSFNVSTCNTADNSWDSTYPIAKFGLRHSRRKRLAQVRGEGSQKQFKPRPLINASQEELNQYALELVYARKGGVISGKPKVVVAKLITKEEDLYEIGLGKMIQPKLDCEKDQSFNPYIVAIVKGNFNAEKYIGGDPSIPARYIIFEVIPETGFLSYLQLEGGYSDDIRRALKDPTFPKDRPRDQKAIREIKKAPRATPAKARCYPKSSNKRISY